VYNLIKSILSKRDITAFIDSFVSYSDYDSLGVKHYLVCSDKTRDGQITLMRYADNTWSYHGLGDTYCDACETTLSSLELERFIWENRAAINTKLKKQAQPA
jgi:hypothetical protein